MESIKLVRNVSYFTSLVRKDYLSGMYRNRNKNKEDRKLGQTE